MALDPYALCPCGSGKKLKFCTKCRDSVGELDKLLKLIEGGQLVAALDRCNSLLETHPTAAWIYAIKGRLLLSLREYETLRDNADRFLRLQPTNPLALTQRSAYLSAKGDVTGAAGSLLEALAESGENVDSLVIDVCSALSLALASRGIYLSSRAFAALPLLAEGYEGARAAAIAMSQINGSPGINQFLKWLPEPPRVPAGQPWSERLGEAVRLLENQKILSAESKLQSLDQQVGGQEPILIGLLTCAIWRADTRDQQKIFRRLSELEQLDESARARYLALSLLVDPEDRGLGQHVVDMVWDVEKLDEVTEAFAADSRTLSLPPQLLQSFAGQEGEEDTVPPRAGFQFLDREAPSGEGLPAVEEVPEVIANVLLFGRQTDRPARVVALSVPDRYRRETIQLVQQIAQLENAAPTEENEGFTPLLEAIHGTPPVMRISARQSDVMQLQRTLFEQRMAGRLSATSLGLFDGKSLQEVAGDDSYRLQRVTLVRVAEQYQDCASVEPAMEELRKIAGVDPLPPVKLDGRHPEEVPAHELNRLDPSGLSVEQLAVLLERSRTLNSQDAMARLAKKLIALDPAGQLAPAKLLAYLALSSVVDDTSEALRLIEEGKAWAERTEGVNDADLLMAELSIRISGGDAEGFRSTLQTLTTKHSNNPRIMAQLQQMLVQLGVLNPDGSMRAAPSQAAQAGAMPAAAPGAPGVGPAVPGPGAAAPSSGLWTPGGGSPAGPPAGGEGGSSGKIWVPGMD